MRSKKPLWVSLGWNLKIISLYLNLAPSNLSNYQTSWNNKNVWVCDQKCLNSGLKVPFVDIFRLEFEKKYVKPAPWIFLVAKFGAKINILIFETKLPDLGFFGLKLKKKNCCHIWNKHPRICQKWVFNSYSKFWYRVCFFLRSGSGYGFAL